MNNAFQPGDKVLLGDNANVCSPQWVEFLTVLIWERDDDGDIGINGTFEAFRFSSSLWTPEKLGQEVEAYLKGVDGEEPIAFEDFDEVPCEEIEVPNWICIAEQCIAEGLLIVPVVREPAVVT